MGEFGLLFENIDCMGAWMSLLFNEKADGERFVVMGIVFMPASPINILDMDPLPGEICSGEVGVPLLPAVFVSIGLLSGEAPLREGVGELLLAGEDEPFGEPILLIIVEEIVLRAACLALSVFTKFETKSSKFPFKFGEARSSRGPTSVVSDGPCDICVIDDPLEGDSLVDEPGEEIVDCLGDEESDPGLLCCCTL